MIFKWRTTDRNKRHNKGIHTHIYQLLRNVEYRFFGITQSRQNIGTDLTTPKHRNRFFEALHVTLNRHSGFTRHDVFTYFLRDDFQMHT